MYLVTFLLVSFGTTHNFALTTVCALALDPFPSFVNFRCRRLYSSETVFRTAGLSCLPAALRSVEMPSQSRIWSAED